jgi:hypothetical protein
MGADLALKRVEDAKAKAFVEKAVAIPKNVITLDEASVLVVDDRGRRWRLPRASKAYDAATNAGELRICREVATERDMLSACGTFFELPAENADGFAKIRPICSHDLRVTDFGGYRGLFLMSGIKPMPKPASTSSAATTAKPRCGPEPSTTSGNSANPRRRRPVEEHEGQSRPKERSVSHVGLRPAHADAQPRSKRARELPHRARPHRHRPVGDISNTAKSPPAKKRASPSNLRCRHAGCA